MLTILGLILDTVLTIIAIVCWGLAVCSVLSVFFDRYTWLDRLADARRYQRI